MKLYASNRTARLGAIKARRCRQASRNCHRTPVGEAATHRGRRNCVEHGGFFLLKPVSCRVGARDRRDQELRIGVARVRHHLFYGTRFDEVRPVEDENGVADLVSGGEVWVM